MEIYSKSDIRIGTSVFEREIGRKVKYPYLNRRSTGKKTRHRRSKKGSVAGRRRNKIKFDPRVVELFTRMEEGGKIVGTALANTRESTRGWSVE